MTPAELRSEIFTGPLSATLAPSVAIRADNDIATVLNRKGAGSIAWGVPWATLATWAAGNGVRALLQAGADNTATDAGSIGIRAICLTVLDNLRGSLQTTMLDLTSPATDGMLGALVQAGIMTAAQQTELIALGTLSASRIEMIENTIGASVSHADVSVALNLE